MLVVATRGAAERPGGDLESLRSRIEAILERERVAGAGVALVGRDGFSWCGGVGVANRQDGRPVTADTAFRAGSVSKSLVGLAVMRLVEQGRLSLDGRLCELAPEVPFENPWEADHPVRVAHLLEHTAGWEFLRYNEWFDAGPKPRSLWDALAVNPRSRRSRWPPGTRGSYSNEGYLAAGYLIEKVTGRDFDEAMRELVLEALGMGGAFWRTPDLAGRLAQGYGRLGPLEYEEDMMRPAAGLVASSRDMLRYLEFWVGREPPDAKALISARGRARIERRTTLPWDGPDDQYGLGNALIQRDGFVGRGHEGWTFGFVARFAYFPSENLGWAVLLNASGGASAAAAIEEELLRFLSQGHSAAGRPAASLDAGETRDLVGFYENAAPDAVLTSALAGLSGMELAERAGALWVREPSAFSLRGLFSRAPWVRLEHAGGGAFRRAGDAASTILAVRMADGRRALVTGLGHLERSPGWRATTGRTLLAVGLLCALSALALLPLWLLPWMFRASLPPHLGARVLPALAASCLVAFWALGRWSPQLWGRLNATSVAICALSWAFPILSAAALVAAIALPVREVDPWVKLHVALTSFSCAGLAVFAWRAQWVGIRLWAW